MVRSLLPFAVLAALISCTPWADEDDDGDGLSNGDEDAAGTDPAKADSDDDGVDDAAEAAQGTDPLVPDSDGDGLEDGEEAGLGTDPNEVDSDGDGYRDGDEVREGSDPADAGSRIYAGGWPYQADKDAFGGPTLEEGVAEEGELFARLQLVDQFGDTFDLYDLAGQGKPILIDISAIWCGPCNGLSQWLSGTGDDYDWDSPYGNIKDMIDSGDMYWVTILGQNLLGKDPTLAQIQAWDEKYPNEHIPVLVGDGDIADKYVLGGWPSVYFLGEDMVIQALPVGTSSRFYDALDTANDYQPE